MRKTKDKVESLLSCGYEKEGSGCQYDRRQRQLEAAHQKQQSRLKTESFHQDFGECVYRNSKMLLCEVKLSIKICVYTDLDQLHRRSLATE
ncbi:hypothetical protein SK128_028127 [Halocaridina rubra]|uniref:Uncharacterized protein n=1 Tax=Halocaridina rubra TaxID=373956 RepID=A0AAN8ZZK0_HALRR